MTLGDRIRELRNGKGWTQGQLAHHARVSQQTIAKIETGNTDEPKTLPRIAAALGESVETLLGNVVRVARPAPAPRSSRTRGARSRWPFGFPFSRFEALPAPQKSQIEDLLWSKILQYEARRPPRPLPRQKRAL